MNKLAASGMLCFDYYQDLYVKIPSIKSCFHVWVASPEDPSGGKNIGQKILQQRACKVQKKPDSIPQESMLLYRSLW